MMAHSGNSEGLVNRPVLSASGKRLKAFFLQNKDVISWRRAKELDKVAAELINLHRCSITMHKISESRPSTDLRISLHMTCNGSSVTHMGEGVFIQQNQYGIDPDSDIQPWTVTTKEIRYFALLCLKVTLAENFHNLVLGTGQPQIGKTRGALAYTLQELLWRGEAVMRVSYKDNTAKLFLPEANGSYQCWQSTEVSKWNESLLVAEKTMFALLDPPEHPNYERSGTCHIMEFCSNDDLKHIKNISKDGTLLHMDMPHFSEILCMVPALYTASKFKIEHAKEPQDINCALYLRCSLVGCVPGIVFNGPLFIEKLLEIEQNAKEQCNSSNFHGLLDFYKGGRVGKHKSSSSANSRFFYIKPKANDRRFAVAYLNPATSYYIQEELSEKIARLTGAQAFEFEDVCAMLLKGGTWGSETHPERQIICGANIAHTTGLIKALTEDQGTVVRASNCYPILDFATANNKWYNAKVGESKPKVSLSAFVTIMVYLRFAKITGSKLVMCKGAPKQIELMMIRNKSDYDGNVGIEGTLAKKYQDLRMDPKQILGVFKERVALKIMFTAHWSPPPPANPDDVVPVSGLLNAFDARMSLIQSTLSTYETAMENKKNEDKGDDDEAMEDAQGDQDVFLVTAEEV